MKEIGITLFIALVSLAPIYCQTNGVRTNLIPCYNASELPQVLIANGRPPASLNIFIEFIRRLEDANPTLTPREVSVLILQRLRQDGIMRTRSVADSRFGIPFSPKRLEAYKSTLFLTRYLTNSSLELNYGNLDVTEVCALHYMISSTIQNNVRGDESTTCSRSSRYTSRIFRRRRRDVDVTESTVQPDGNDVENRGTAENVEVEGIEGFGVRSVAATGSRDMSTCPIELGVVYTNYGAIKAGQVLAGIAAGLNFETVATADNRYAATLAGELAEAALAQTNVNVEIGASGGWNNTINPRYYFLQRNTQLQATDAEIRGSLDGLYIALSLQRFQSTFSDIKISQMLDMYYSPEQKGIFDPNFRSCNRNILYTEMVTTETLQTQVLNFMGPLDEASQYGQTITAEAYSTLSQAVVSSFNNYFPSMNTDPNCKTADSYTERVATDLLIFLDANWNYNTLQSVLSYVLENIDVNKYGTRYTIFNGRDGTNITSNSTIYLLDFHKQYNLTVHDRLTKNFDYVRVCETVETIGRAKLNNNTYSGGESTIVLLVPRNVPSETDKTFLTQRKEIIQRNIPDLTILVLGSGSQDDYSSLLSTPNKDFISLSETTSEEQLKTTGQNVVERIANVPRAIINPSCGPEFAGSTSTFSLTQYVELGGVNYYRISPNYFASGDGTRNLKVTENSYGSISICTSRDQSKPTNQTGACETLRSSVLTLDISSYCGGSVSDCSPIYFAVIGNTSDVKCKDSYCRFPNDIKFTISLENVGCQSSAIRVIANFLVVAVLFVVLGF